MALGMDDEYKRRMYRPRLALPDVNPYAASNPRMQGLLSSAGSIPGRPPLRQQSPPGDGGYKRDMRGYRSGVTPQMRARLSPATRGLLDTPPVQWPPERGDPDAAISPAVRDMLLQDRRARLGQPPPASTPGPMSAGNSRLAGLLGRIQEIRQGMGQGMASPSMMAMPSAPPSIPGGVGYQPQAARRSSGDILTAMRPDISPDGLTAAMAGHDFNNARVGVGMGGRPQFYSHTTNEVGGGGIQDKAAWAAAHGLFYKPGVGMGGSVVENLTPETAGIYGVVGRSPTANASPEVLAANREAYQARRSKAMSTRQAGVQQQAVARGQARDARLAARNAAPDPLAVMAARNPRLAVELAQLRQQGLLGQRELDLKRELGQGEIDVAKADAQARLAGYNREADAQRIESATQLTEAISAAEAMGDYELADQYRGMLGGLTGRGGAPAAAPSSASPMPAQVRGRLTSQQFEALGKTPIEEQEAMLQRLAPNLDDEAREAVLRAAQGLPPSSLMGRVGNVLAEGSAGIMSGVTNFFGVEDALIEQPELVRPRVPARGLLPSAGDAPSVIAAKGGLRRRGGRAAAPAPRPGMLEGLNAWVNPMMWGR